MVGLAVVCLQNNSFSKFRHYAFQEFATAAPEQGFEYIVGYRAERAFYWQEIVASKEYKLEVLRQLGETPESQRGRLLPSVSVERYLEWQSKRKESLYLVVDFLDSPNEVPARTDMPQVFAANARAFVAVLKSRGVVATPTGEVAFWNHDVGSWKIIAGWYWLEFLSIGVVSSLVTALLLRPKAIPGAAAGASEPAKPKS